MIREFENDTIAAISTPLGAGGIGIVRLSGPAAIQIVDQIFKSKSGASVKTQKTFSAQVGHILTFGKEDGSNIIDEVIVLVMRAPKSYTCQDVVEISAHGGQATLKAVLDQVISAGARLAAPGEFTKRAFLNGRIDLLQAEAVLDLIEAKTELSSRWAVSQLEGFFSKKIINLKNQLVQILSHLEAAIDFPDDDPDNDSLSVTARQIEAIAGELRSLLSTAEMGFISKQGLRVVLVGKPNVGKSSLMNALSKSNRVIVTEIPGTTRDVVEEMIQIKGFPILLSDTAGIRDTDHPIEKEGVERSKRAMGAADLILFVTDQSQDLTEEDKSLYNFITNKNRIIILNKMDLGPRSDMAAYQFFGDQTPRVFCSCTTRAGLEELEDIIFRIITGGKISISDEVIISSVRQKELIQKALSNLVAAKKACDEGLSPEFCAADIRETLNCLGELAGEVVTDDVLELLFSRFCIGK